MIQQTKDLSSLPTKQTPVTPAPLICSMEYHDLDVHDSNQAAAAEFTYEGLKLEKESTNCRYKEKTLKNLLQQFIVNQSWKNLMYTFECSKLKEIVIDMLDINYDYETTIHYNITRLINIVNNWIHICKECVYCQNEDTFIKNIHMLYASVDKKKFITMQEFLLKFYAAAIGDTIQLKKILIQKQISTPDKCTPIELAYLYAGGDLDSLAYIPFNEDTIANSSYMVNQRKWFPVSKATNIRSLSQKEEMEEHVKRWRTDLIHNLHITPDDEYRYDVRDTLLISAILKIRNMLKKKSKKKYCDIKKLNHRDPNDR